MEETELRNLKIAVSLPLRGTLSPSKNSYLPTFIEQAQPTLATRKPRKESKEIVRHDGAAKFTETTSNEANVLSCFDAKYLPAFQEDFESAGGSLNINNFVDVMLPRISRSVSEDRPDQASDTAALISIFNHADVHSLGYVTWEAFSSYLIDQGMSRKDESNVDVIKMYDASPVVDTSKHAEDIDRLLYVEKMDALVCIHHNARHFSVYDSTKLTFRQDVHGHRGSVIAATYCEALGQLVTTGADLQVCFWDSTKLEMRNRLSCKEVQLCITTCDINGRMPELYSGSMDGTLYRWDLEHMCLAEGKKGFHKRAINDILMIYDINFLATASTDGAILMWDTSQLKPKKTLLGHRKGVYSLAYSTDYHCVLSAGLEQEALIWNPYVERVPIFRLKGHSQALCAVDVVPGTPQIVTADVTGTFKLWDMRNFRCVQTFGIGASDTHDLNTFTLVNLPGGQMRIAAGSSSILCFDNSATQGVSEKVTDTVHISHTLYNPESGSFYTVAKRNVTEWSAEGAIQTVLREIVPHEITAIALSGTYRKFYIGDVMGSLSSHNAVNGSKLQSFEPHSSDVSNIEVFYGTSGWFVSTSWDGALRIHMDVQDANGAQVKADWKPHCTTNRDTELRGESTCITIGEHLKLLASGGTDCKVVFFDLKAMKKDSTLSGFQNEITAIALFEDRALCAVGCQGGTCSIWRVRPYAYQCIAAFENLERGLHPCAVTAFRFHQKHDGHDTVRHVYSSDMRGTIRCWSLEFVEGDDVNVNSSMTKATLQSPETPLDFAEWAVNQLRNRRELLRSPSPAVMDTTPFVTEVPTPGTGCGYALPLAAEVDGHSGESATLDLIRGEVNTLVTTGADKKVKIWRTLDLKPLGILSQRSHKDGSWHFPFDSKLHRTGLKLKEAEELLDNLPKTDKRVRPKLARSDSGAKAEKTKQESLQWKVGCQSLLNDDTANSTDDFLILYDQMQNAEETIGERLSRQTREKMAAAAPQRQTALSDVEAKAADRLAKALASLGNDEFGLYRRMADSVQPRRRESKGSREMEVT